MGYCQAFWIGLNDMAIEGQYVWEHNGQAVSQPVWDILRPTSTSVDRDCIMIEEDRMIDQSC